MTAALLLGMMTGCVASEEPEAGRTAPQEARTQAEGLSASCGNGVLDASEACDDGNTDSCDGCSSTCQLETLRSWYPDADGDGFGNARASAEFSWCALAGMVANNTDCDDSNAAVHPGATDICGDGIDQDCDGSDALCGASRFTTTGESFVSGSVTGSHLATRVEDGVGQTLSEVVSGNGKNAVSVLEHHWTLAGISGAPNRLVVVARQNGSTEGDSFIFSVSTNGSTWTDAITVGTNVTSFTRFTAPINLGGASTVYVRVLDGNRTGGRTIIDTLVVDSLAIEFSAVCGDGVIQGSETCDDGNTTSCDGCSASCGTEPLRNWYPDADGDSFGDSTAAPQAAFCAPPGKVADNADCDDTNPAIHPGALDICSDGIDQNCAGGDQVCICGDGQLGATEVCDDGNRSSCDGCSADCKTIETKVAWYPDADGDGFGSKTGSAVMAFCAPTGSASNNTDCDDSNPTIHPGAHDVCGDGIDQDCNGQDRTCVLGSSCTTSAECPTGFCADGVCCESACDEGCKSCNHPLGSPGRCVSEFDMTADPACGAYTCYGGKCSTSCLWMGSVLFDGLCTTGNYCATNGTCQAKKTNGGACATANECTSGICTDGVCCDSTCGGACDACNVTGQVGTCSRSPAGTSGAPSCAPYLCNGAGTSCPAGCVRDADCIGDYFCEAGTCRTKLDIGKSCTSALQCASGFCVDGYCCNNSCNGDCDACDVPGSYGSCTPRPAGTQGSPSCSPFLCDGERAVCPMSCESDAGCVANSTCDSLSSTCTAPSGLTNGQACTFGSECQSSFCVDGVCCDTTCGAACDACNLAGTAGTCTIRPAGSAGEPSCSPNLCGGEAECATSCESNADCASGLPCNGGVCAIPFVLTRGWGGMESLDEDNPAAKLRFFIETATQASLHVLANSKDVAVSLINPAGQEILVGNAAAAGISARYWDTASPELELGGGPLTPFTERGSHFFFEMPSPAPGEWFVKLSARTRPVTSTLIAQVRLLTDGGAATALLTDKSVYAPGEPVTVWLHVRDLNFAPPAPITGATAKLVFLELYEDQNKRRSIPPKPLFKTVELLDDGKAQGLSGDATVGDGIYTGRFQLEKAAPYILSAEIRGTDINGKVWVRTSTTLIEVE